MMKVIGFISTVLICIAGFTLGASAGVVVGILFFILLLALNARATR